MSKPVVPASLAILLSIFLLAGSAFAQLRADPSGKEPAAGQSPTVLPEIKVVDQRGEDSAGEIRLDRKTIDALPKGNGDIPSLLKIHPNVQFDSRVLQSAQQGEIAPADISINGSKFYQNSYRLDGMGISNHLDPGSSKTQNVLSTVVGRSTGVTLDSSLICEVLVRDANVAAEYGGFTGGVVEAKTCAPKRDFGGQISLQMARSSWMHAYIDDRFKEVFEKSTEANSGGQPRFDKQTWRLALEGRPTQNTGLIASFVQTASDIPLNAYTSGGAASPRNDLTETRRLENYFIRGFWNPSADVSADLSITRAPSRERRFINSWQNSGWTNSYDGDGVNAGLLWKTGAGLLSQRLSWMRTQSSRIGQEASSIRWWLASPEKNWAPKGRDAAEGGRGDLLEKERNFTYFAKFDWTPVHWGAFKHSVQSGAEISRVTGSFGRDKTYYAYLDYANAANCVGPDGRVDHETCSLSVPYSRPAWTGQFFNERQVIGAYRAEVTGTKKTVFLQDEIERGNVRLRLGLRYEDDPFARKSVWAPRLAGFWDVFGDQATRLETGFNRYYADQMLVYQLGAHRMDNIHYETRPSMAMPWQFDSKHTWLLRAQPLETPYEDETMLALTQHWAGFSWTAKWVGRKGRKQVAFQTLLDPVDNRAYSYYGNLGRSSADTFSLTVETQKPWQVLGTRTDAMLILDRTRVEATNLAYGDQLDALLRPIMIRYNGTLMPLSQRPVDNFVRPWTARFFFNTEIPSTKLKIGNFFRYRAAYTQVAAVGSLKYTDPGTGKTTNITDYAPRRFGGALTWDLTATWTMPIVAQQAAYVTLTVNNALDRKIPAYDSGTNSLGILYDMGRQFWLEAGYKF